MDNTQIVRTNIDDHVQIGFAHELSIGNPAIFQMNNHNIWDVVVTDSEGETIDDESYEVFPQSGQIKGTFPEGEITFEYKYAGFTDEEIEHYLTINGDSTNKATLDCLNILLASAAKRFDYKAGLKDIKASQVFDNLKELKAIFTGKVEVEDQTGAQATPIFVNRISPYYQQGRTIREDISRSDRPL